MFQSSAAVQAVLRTVMDSEYWQKPCKQGQTNEETHVKEDCLHHRNIKWRFVDETSFDEHYEFIC